MFSYYDTKAKYEKNCAILRIIGKMSTKIRVSDDGVMLSVIMQDNVKAGDHIEQIVNISEYEAIWHFFRENENTGLTHEIGLENVIKTEVSKRVLCNQAQEATRLIITLSKSEKKRSMMNCRHDFNKNIIANFANWCKIIQKLPQPQLPRRFLDTPMETVFEEEEFSLVLQYPLSQLTSFCMRATNFLKCD